MKLKYKKVILLTTMSTMGIGLLTLSISQDRPEAKENPDAGLTREASAMADADDADDASGGITLNEDGEALMAANFSIPTVSPTPSPSPTPTPIPVYDLEEIPEIDAFMGKYYEAKAAIDIEKLRSMHSDPSQVMSLEELQSKMMYIEEYLNIKTYSKKGPEEGSYIVYAYHEIKFSNISTLAPGVGKLYLITDEEGNFKIFSGNMSPEVKAYFDARNEDEDVIRLLEETDAKGEAAKAKDEDLQIYWEGIDKLATKN